LGGTNSNSQHPEVQFDASGYYTVSLTATNASGSDNETKYDYILVFPAPLANFEADNTNPFVAETVNLTDLSSNNPTSWSWSFDPVDVTFVGGTNANSQNPQVQFNSTGYYTVSLTATNASGSDTEVKYDYINVIANEIVLEVKVYLEGPFESFDMTTDINTILPLSQPYSGAPWNYGGSENVGSIPDEDIVDWVLVELRDADVAGNANEASIIATQAAFLRNDGIVLDIDGNPSLTFAGETLNENLFIVIRHRNHLLVMSADAVSYSGGMYAYDFTTDSFKAYGDVEGHTQLSSGEWGMFGGDGDANNLVEGMDYSPLWEDASGTTGYQPSDFNLDSHTNNLDKDDIWVGNQNRYSVVPE